THDAQIHRDRRAEHLAIVARRDEAAPRLHQPAVVDILRSAEDLTRTRAELPLEVVAEGLLDHVADLGEIPLADAPDLDVRRAAFRIESCAVDRGPHVPLARSSSSVITPE